MNKKLPARFRASYIEDFEEIALGWGMPRRQCGPVASRGYRSRRAKGSVITCRLVLTAMMVLFGGLLACGDTAPKPLPDAAFQVAFESHKLPSEMKVGETVDADITVKNASPVSWPSLPDVKGRYAVNFSYHWLTLKGDMAVFDGLRTPLPKDLNPGESVDLHATIQAPKDPGRYMLEITLVQENSAWFPEKNGGKLLFPVTVFHGDEFQTKTAGVTLSEKAGSQQARPDEKAEKSLTDASGGHLPPVKSAAGGFGVSPEKHSTAAARPERSWTVQLGSFSKRETAASLATDLKKKGYDAYVTAVGVKGERWHRVRVGRFERRMEAEKLRETLRVVENLDRSMVTSR